jgi:acyl carrier protein
MNVDARIVVPKPVEISFEEAAAAPITYLTSEYALNHLGRMKEGERVLIHAAAGGVGLAAIQIAQLAGAEIFATAGSDEKRKFVRDLGVKFVSDSRSLAFADEIRKETDGEGIDLVLNSLADDFIQANLELLRPYGRFLEIGKRDIYQNSPIGLSPFRNNLSLHAIDLSPMIAIAHPVLVEMFSRLAESLKEGKLKPGPILTVPWHEAQSAMEHMAAARHIGKIVLEICPPARRKQKQLSEEELFNKRYVKSIPLQEGLDIFQEIIMAEDVPSHVLVSPRLSEGKLQQVEAPSLQGSKGSGQRNASVEYVAPSNATEEEIVLIWQQVLSINPIGVNDNFVELGGDSISAIQVLNRMRKRLDVELTNDVLFRHQTPAELASLILGEQEIDSD